MKSSTRASRNQKRKAQDAGIEPSKTDSPAPGSAEVRFQSAVHPSLFI
jgi:hypothetical protein